MKFPTCESCTHCRRLSADNGIPGGADKKGYPVLDYGNSIGVKIRGYKSPFLDDIYPTWNLAFEKTLAKLKEVCNAERH